MNKIIESILDVFFPKRCIICGKTLEAGKEISLCDKCEEKSFIKYHNPSLPQERFFDDCIFCLPYLKNIKNSMLNFKFKNQYTLSKTFAHISCEKLKKENLKDIDVIVPVPISDKRKRERGYNQSELIAKIISHKLNIPLDTDIIKKVKDIAPLSLMKAYERAKAIKGAYKAEKYASKKNILLIDDIYTTGSTVNECARTLKKMGAESVKVFCVCVTVTKDAAKTYEEIIDEGREKSFFNLF